VIALLSALAAELYFHASASPDQLEHARGWPGLRAGFLIGATCSAFELFVVAGPAGSALRRWPFLRLLAFRIGVNAALILSVLALNILLGRVLDEGWTDAAVEPARVLRNTAFSLLVLTGAVFVVQTQSLLGSRAIFNLVLGRYYRPRHEQRVFLLLDVKGSTPLAVRLGDEQFHELLSAIFFDVDTPITELGGEIYEYVGDAVIASWRVGPAAELDAIEAVFAARDTLRRRAPWYRQAFGVVPELRAVLHRGSVVAGACGASKRQIVFRGETLNTIARLEELAKALDKDIVATDSGSGLRLPMRVEAQDHGRFELKGLAVPVRVVSLIASAEAQVRT
jgi:adenylate cyclase